MPISDIGESYQVPASVSGSKVNQFVQTSVDSVDRCTRDAALIYRFIIRHIATLKTKREYTAGTLCRLKCKMKYKYQSTLKLNLGLWPNSTRPDPTRSDPRVGSRVVQLWSTRNISSKFMHAFVSNLANRQTNRQTGAKHVPPPLFEVMNETEKQA